MSDAEDTNDPTTTDVAIGKRGTVSHRRRWILLVTFALIGGLLILGGICAVQALQVRDALMAAKSRIDRIIPLARSGDLAEVDRLAGEVQELTASANSIVQGPLWSVASAVPGIGANVTAVSETTQATHILVRDALPLASELLSLADPASFAVAGGGIDLEPIRLAQPKIPAIREAFSAAKTHVDRVHLDATLPIVRDNIAQLVAVVEQATPALAFAEKYLPNVLSVLGGDGPRSYVLLFQNNAEIRSTGGNPAAGAVLTVDNGKVAMREDAAALSLFTIGPEGTFPQHLAQPAEEGLFESDTWSYSQNYTRPPDFGDTAHLVRGLWAKAVGGPLDGIISLDPVALSYLLKVSGPVSVPGEGNPVTADNAVRLLLFDTYERVGGVGPLADLYFAKVSSAVFSTVMSGGWDPLQMLEQLQRAAREQRVYAWFAKAAEANIVKEIGIDGAVTNDNSDVTQTGIYLNDSSHSKLAYFLSAKMFVTCSAADRTMTTTVELHNAIPGPNLNSYTLGGRNERWGYPRTTMLLDVIGIALPGGKLVQTEPKAGERRGQDRATEYKGRQAKSLFVTVAKDETKRVAFTSTIPEGASGTLQVRYSPTVTQTPVTVDESCSALFPKADLG